MEETGTACAKCVYKTFHHGFTEHGAGSNPGHFDCVENAVLRDIGGWDAAGSVVKYMAALERKREISAELLDEVERGLETSEGRIQLLIDRQSSETSLLKIPWSAQLKSRDEIDWDDKKDNDAHQDWVDDVLRFEELERLQRWDMIKYFEEKVAGIQTALQKLKNMPNPSPFPKYNSWNK